MNTKPRARKMRRVNFAPEDGSPRRTDVVMRERHFEVLTQAATKKKVGMSRYLLDAGMEAAGRDLGHMAVQRISRRISRRVKKSAESG